MGLKSKRAKQLKKDGRCYVCHTYYHAYVSILKELNLPKEERGNATMILSTMSTQFETFPERLKNSHLFKEVVLFAERRDFPELEKYQKDKGNMVSNMISRIIYTGKLAKLTEPLVPVDMTQYRDICVYCDLDPIGFYLNRKKIPYHAAEDGTNTVYHLDAAWVANKSCFRLKTIMSSKFNLIFIQNGYGKYCLDMEVNDIGILKRKCPKYVEVPLKKLEEGVREEDREILVQTFVRNQEELYRRIEDCGSMSDKILILTEPLCDLDTRRRLFRDLCEEYEKEGVVFLKPHPRDELDYEKEFSQYPQFDAKLPMEILNYFPNLHFKKVVGVWSEMKKIRFADEVIRLGKPFMDRYEDPEIHKDGI